MHVLICMRGWDLGRLISRNPKHLLKLARENWRFSFSQLPPCIGKGGMCFSLIQETTAGFGHRLRQLP